jgi:F420-dependent oxidoreductase-like protein
MAIGCFISPGRSFERAVERLRLAEELGYDTALTNHIAAWDSLTVLAAYARETERINLGTGVVPIYTRTPATMAQTAASIDTFSGGRMRLGLGVSHKVTVEGWHGTHIGRPAKEMREYVTIVRAILRGEEPPAGERWQTAFRLAGLDPRPELPIWIAALSPVMLRLAGQIADGVVLWLCNPNYIRDVVVPEVRAGAERAGRSPDDVTIVAAVPSAAVDDPAPVRETLRGELLTYFSLPFYRAMLERSGFGDDLAAFDAAGAKGDIDGMRAAISDGFLDLLAAIGDADQVQAGVRRYREAGTTLPAIGPIVRTDADATLRAAIDA